MMVKLNTWIQKPIIRSEYVILPSNASCIRFGRRVCCSNFNTHVKRIPQIHVDIQLFPDTDKLYTGSSSRLVGHVLNQARCCGNPALGHDQRNDTCLVSETGRPRSDA